MPMIPETGSCPSAEVAAQVERDREEIQDILDGEDNRLLVIVGPCSAWPETAVFEYAKRLKGLSDEVSDRLKLVMRAYTQKPRTVDGWNGLLVQPDPFADPNMNEGLRQATEIMEQIVRLGLPVADEALFLEPSRILSQWLSWTAIGARSSEDQEHRAYASGIGIPVGMKHPTSGSIPVGVNGVVAARSAQFSPLFSTDSFTAGNPYAHLVLRGGTSGPNYDAEYIREAGRLMRERGIGKPVIIVDASHDNAKVDGAKDPKRQIDVIKDVLDSIERDPEVRGLVRGFMLESFLKSGNQDLKELTTETIDRGGCSVTDPCLSWEETVMLLRDMNTRP
jgi:3-deoxy-7-phosphoheptulonate synthase